MWYTIFYRQPTCEWQAIRYGQFISADDAARTADYFRKRGLLVTDAQPIRGFDKGVPLVEKPELVEFR